MDQPLETEPSEIVRHLGRRVGAPEERLDVRAFRIDALEMADQERGEMNAHRHGAHCSTLSATTA
jgi:hypothetical protein